MKASEALKHLTGGFGDDWNTAFAEACAALREKAEREEQERPKVTLADMARICEATSRGAKPVKRGLTILASAAATLRKLDEEGGKLLAELDRMIAAKRTLECVTWRPTAALLRSLGVEPKP